MNSITELKNCIETKYGVEKDLMSFNGIDAKLLIESINESIDLLESIGNLKENFETIYMERKLNGLTQRCTAYLIDKVELKSEEKGYDEFFDNIFEIRCLVKTTYQFVIEGTIKNESLDVTTLYEDIVKQKEEIKGIQKDLNESTRLRMDESYSDSKYEYSRSSTGVGGLVAIIAMAFMTTVIGLIFALNS